MAIIVEGITLGLILLIILLIVIHIMKKYMDIANIIGGKILDFFSNLFHKIKG